MRHLLISYLILFISACGSSSDNISENNEEVIDLYITSNVSLCKTLTSQYCLQGKIDNEQNYTTLYENIDGFTFQMGYEFHLKVNKITRQPSTSDQNPYYFELIEVIAKEASSVAQHSLAIVPASSEWQNLPNDLANLKSWEQAKIQLNLPQASTAILYCEDTPDVCKTVYEEYQIGNFSYITYLTTKSEISLKFSFNSFVCAASEGDFIQICGPFTLSN